MKPADRERIRARHRGHLDVYAAASWAVKEGVADQVAGFYRRIVRRNIYRRAHPPQDLGGGVTVRYIPEYSRDQFCRAPFRGDYMLDDLAFDAEGLT